MMFGLSTFKLIGAAIAIAAIVGGIAAWKASIYNDGRKFERAIWEKAIADQKAEAAALLADEAAKVIAVERRLSTLTAEIEASHVKAKSDLAAAGAKYDRLGLVFERTKARCGGGGGGASGAVPSPAAVDPGGTDTGADVLGAGGRAFRELIFDADRMRTAFMACRGYVEALPKLAD